MKKILLIVVCSASIVMIGLLLYQNTARRNRTITAPSPAASVAIGSSALAATNNAEHYTPQTSNAEEQKRIMHRKALEEGLKLFKQGAFARTYARLEPVLRQSGLSAAEIDSAIESYIGIVFTSTKEEHEAKIQTMKEQFGTEVYEGMEKAEEAYRDRVRDDQLLDGLKTGLPSVQDTDVAAAAAIFPKLPNFNTLYMEQVKYQSSEIDLRANMKAVAEAAFDKAFTNSRVSASVREELKKTYVNIALSMTPSRRK